MKKFFVLVFVISFLLQISFLRRAEAGSGKLLLGIGFTAAGAIGILVGNEEVEVLENEYDFYTWSYVALWDQISGECISELYDFQIDPHPETIVEKDIEEQGMLPGTNYYNFYFSSKSNHHEEYKTEKRTNTIGYAGYTAAGIGVTLIIDHFLEKTEFTKRAGLEIRTVARPGYSGFVLTKRY